ncbi:hypothetical protein XENORESO_002955 [Xenotaenia resolanae]|uniref:Uncharacterized protein n=1 Tax=Xenotaenia resolanae TaxID=208358 RepID=A0ABV0W379_9TELE
MLADAWRMWSTASLHLCSTSLFIAGPSEAPVLIIFIIAYIAGEESREKKRKGAGQISVFFPSPASVRSCQSLQLRRAKGARPNSGGAPRQLSALQLDLIPQSRAVQRERATRLGTPSDRRLQTGSDGRMTLP